MINTILCNLLSNAIKFTHKSGKVTVSVIMKIRAASLNSQSKSKKIKSLQHQKIKTRQNASFDFAQLITGQSCKSAV
jgi:K+-sensing histidine kinase KdpD